MYTPNPYFSIEVIDLSDDSQVNSGGGTDTQTLQAPAGYIYQVFAIEYNNAAIGGASGDHKFYIRWTDGTNTKNAAQLVGTDGASMAIDLQYGFAASSEFPSSISDQLNFICGRLFASNTYYVDFYYINSSDTNKTGTRTLKIWVKKYKEA